MSWLITGAGADPQLLDAYPGAAAAYSLRSLSWAYGGPVVRVRRSSDNTEQDFTAAQITDGTLAAFCGAGDGFVRTWYDQSGNGCHAQQLTSASQPQIVSSGVLLAKNGKAAMALDGAGDTLTASIPSLLTYSNFSVFAVNNPANASAADTTSQVIFGIQAGGAARSFPGLSYGAATGAFTAEQISLFFTSPSVDGGRLGSSSYSHAADAQLLHSTFWLTSGFQGFKNGSAISMDLQAAMSTATPCAPANTTASIPNFHIGTINGEGGSIQKFQEVMVYGSNQITNRTAIEANINAHYSIF